MPQTTIDLKELEVYEAGAILLTLLAYPGKTDSDEVRGNLQASLCALALRAQVEHDEAWAQQRQSIKPIYACRRDREIRRDLKTFGRRLRDRGAAGRMAIAFLKEAMTGKQPKLPAGVKRLSVNALADLVASDAGQQDAKKTVSRAWKPSQPVIHIAAAMQVLEQTSARAGHDLGFGHVLTDRSVIEAVVAHAEYFEGLISRSVRFRIPAEDLYRVRIK